MTLYEIAAELEALFEPHEPCAKAIRLRQLAHELLRLGAEMQRMEEQLNERVQDALAVRAAARAEGVLAKREVGRGIKVLYADWPDHARHE